MNTSAQHLQRSSDPIAESLMAVSLYKEGEDNSLIAAFHIYFHLWVSFF